MSIFPLNTSDTYFWWEICLLYCLFYSTTVTNHELESCRILCWRTFFSVGAASFYVNLLQKSRITLQPFISQFLGSIRNCWLSNGTELRTQVRQIRSRLYSVLCSSQNTEPVSLIFILNVMKYFSWAKANITIQTNLHITNPIETLKGSIKKLSGNCPRRI